MNQHGGFGARAKRIKCTDDGVLLNDTLAAIEPDPGVRAITCVDIGPRNMGVAVLDLARNVFTAIRWVDLFPEPRGMRGKNNFTAHELAPALARLILAEPALFAPAVWVIEMQLIDQQQRDMGKIHNMLMQSVLEAAGTVLGKRVYVVSPAGVQNFFGSAFAEGGHESNKLVSIALAESAMRQDERAMYDREIAVQKARASAHKGVLRHKTDPDDIADAVTKALACGSRVAGRNLWNERTGGVFVPQPTAGELVRRYAAYDEKELRAYAETRGLWGLPKGKRALIDLLRHNGFVPPEK